MRWTGVSSIIPSMSKHDTFLDNLRGEERFKRLMERVKYEWDTLEE